MFRAVLDSSSASSLGPPRCRHLWSNKLFLFIITSKITLSPQYNITLPLNHFIPGLCLVHRHMNRFFVKYLSVVFPLLLGSVVKRSVIYK